MLCTYGYRRAPWGLRGCISEDGIHWDTKDEFVICEGGTAPSAVQTPHAWHIGYPSTVQLQNGTVFTVHHEWTQSAPFVQYVVGYLYDIAG